MTLMRVLIDLAGMVAIVTIGLTTQSAKLKLQGPWAYTQRLDEATNTVLYMAAPPAAEDPDVWLVLGCGGNRRITASLMHVAQFPYALKLPLRITLQSVDHPTVTVAAAVVQRNQLTIDPTVIRHLMPLLTDNDRVVVSISDSYGAMHDYTFSVHPNDVVRGEITGRCSLVDP
jgi:hypothetical protein